MSIGDLDIIPVNYIFWPYLSFYLHILRKETLEKDYLKALLFLLFYRYGTTHGLPKRGDPLLSNQIPDLISLAFHENMVAIATTYIMFYKLECQNISAQS